MNDQLPDGIPAQAAASFLRLMQFPLEEQREMMAAVDRHVAGLSGKGVGPGVVDFSTAQRVARSLKSLLSYNLHSTEELHQRWIQAATRYFFLEDDGAPDTRSVIGFDDDAEVLNAVAEALDRADLLVEPR